MSPDRQASKPALPACAIWSDQRGGISVEFAILGTVFVPLIFGALDLGRYQAVRQALRVAADAAGRIDLVAYDNKWTNGCAAIPAGSTLRTTIVQAQALVLLDPAALTLSQTCSGPDINGVLSVVVSATYPFTFVTPLFSANPMTLAASATVSFNYPEQ